MLSYTPTISSWYEISIKALPLDVPIISEFLSSISPNGIAIEPAIEILSDIDFGFTYRNEPSTIHAYLERPFTPKERVNFRKKLNALPLTTTIPRIRYRLTKDSDWANEWKKYYKIEYIGENIIICPSWIEYQPSDSEIKITLDPGIAFGTGQHPTSQLCLIALEKYIQKEDTVIDLGCGSGILAIGAIMCGAKSVYALDIDENVIEVTIENTKINHLMPKIQAAHGTLGLNWPDQFPQQSSLADLIISNISTNTILELIPLIKDTLKYEGLTILSGFTNDHMQEIIAKLKHHNLKIIDTSSDTNWTCIVAAKN